jgi:hypothetical protein
MAAREMGGLSLADALLLCKLLANTVRHAMSELRCVGCSGSSTSEYRRSPRSRLLHLPLPSFSTVTVTSGLRR